MFRHRLATGLSFLALILAAVPAAAQPTPWPVPPSCFGDDGFNPGCCATPTPNLPNLPALSIPGAWACIDTCTASAPMAVTVSLGAPAFAVCDYAAIDIQVTPSAAGGPAFQGVLLAKYVRTTVERATATGTLAPRQVWRFLLNGDLHFVPNPVGTNACSVPSCAQAPLGLPVHMVGSLDYALECPSPIGAGWRIALSLNHLTGCFFHAPFSQRPLAGTPAHDNRSYHLVAPSHFLFGNVAAPAGNIRADAARSSDLRLLPFHYACNGELRVTLGQLQTASEGCWSCTPVLPVAPALYKHQSLSAGAGCSPLGPVIQIQSVPVPGVLPHGLVALALGSWVGINPDQFPVGRELVVYVGLIQYHDPCSPNALGLHAVTGTGFTTPDPIHTFGAFQALPALHRSVDLQNMLILAPPGPAPSTGLQPGIGSLFAATQVFSFDLP